MTVNIWGESRAVSHESPWPIENVAIALNLYVHSQMWHVNEEAADTLCTVVSSTVCLRIHRNYFWLLLPWVHWLAEVKYINRTVSQWKRGIIWTSPWVPPGRKSAGERQEAERAQGHGVWAMRRICEQWGHWHASTHTDRQTYACLNTNTHTCARGHSTERDPWCSWPWISRLGRKNMSRGIWSWQSKGFEMRVHRRTLEVCLCECVWLDRQKDRWIHRYITFIKSKIWSDSYNRYHTVRLIKDFQVEGRTSPGGEGDRSRGIDI